MTELDYGVKKLIDPVGEGFFKKNPRPHREGKSRIATTKFADSGEIRGHRSGNGIRIVAINPGFRRVRPGPGRFRPEKLANPEAFAERARTIAARGGVGGAIIKRENAVNIAFGRRLRNAYKKRKLCSAPIFFSFPRNIG